MTNGVLSRPISSDCALEMSVQTEGKEPLEKHAYLILAHKADLTYYTLLQLLDDPMADIFVHMDNKASDYHPDEASKHVRFSRIFHTVRTNAAWGGYSLVNAELLLLKEAASVGRYRRYHLLSGEDLPLKTQSVIRDTFDSIGDLECVAFDSIQSQIEDRVHQYHLFQEFLGRPDRGDSGSVSRRVLTYLEKQLLRVQKVLACRCGLIRNRDIEFYKGAQWFSITDNLTRYVLSKESWIRRVFRYTSCADEVFLQTLVMNSDFRDCLKEGGEYESIYRLIDWSRGDPYVFGIKDLQELCDSERLFARKFVATHDSEVIAAIRDFLLENL